METGIDKALHEITTQLDIVSSDGRKAEAGNKSARTRARKALQEIKRIASEARKALLGAKPEADEEAA